jgi:hypothetical protein
MQVVAKYCKMIDVAVKLNPRGECQEDDRKADIEVYLPDKTIVGDVTVSHPAAKSWRTKVVNHGVEVVGNEREAEKVEKYQEMAQQHDKEFQAIAMYTYGGMHHSAKVFLNAICGALDPAVCLLSHSEFKDELKSHIAIALQRGNAAIMIEDSVRARMTENARTRRRYFAAKKSRHQAAVRDASSRDEQVDAACLMRGSPPRVAGLAAGGSDGESDNRCLVDACGGVRVDRPGAQDGGHMVRGVNDRGDVAECGNMPMREAGAGAGSAAGLFSPSARSAFDPLGQAPSASLPTACSASASAASAALDAGVLQHDEVVAGANENDDAAMVNAPAVGMHIAADDPAAAAAASVRGDVRDVCMSGDRVDSVDSVGGVSGGSVSATASVASGEGMRSWEDSSS